MSHLARSAQKESSKLKKKLALPSLYAVISSIGKLENLIEVSSVSTGLSAIMLLPLLDIDKTTMFSEGRSFEEARGSYLEINEREIINNEEYNFSMHAASIEDRDLVYYSDDLPEGAELDAKDGIFTWNPSCEQQGTFEPTIFAPNCRRT